MIKRRKNKNVRPSINILNLEAEVNGNIKVEGDFRIDCKIEGNVNCNGKLTVGKLGIINGDIICNEMEVSGTINGNVNCNGSVYLKKTATFNGTIETEKIMIDFGTKVDMSCKTNVSERKAHLKKSD